MTTTQYPDGGSSCSAVYMMAMEETAALLTPDSGTSVLNQRQRFTQEGDDSDWNLDLSSGGKYYLARRNKPDPPQVIKGFALCLTIIFVFYANLGYTSAQHQVGDRYRLGKGVDKQNGMAMQWFRKAADQGHPHSSYNLAIGHLKGFKTDVKPGKAADQNSSYTPAIGHLKGFKTDVKPGEAR